MIKWNGLTLVDPALKWPLPIKPLIDLGIKRIFIIILGPLDLEPWIKTEKKQNRQTYKTLIDYLNAMRSIPTKNLTNESLKKYLFSSLIERKISELKKKISLEIEDKKIQKKIFNLIDEMRWPYKEIKFFLFSPDKNIGNTFDFNRKSIERMITEGYRLALEKMDEIRKFFE
ncbi:hypothetical protein J7K86_03160 [bacterium]|nr:hypothetical protein [bacterium]